MRLLLGLRLGLFGGGVLGGAALGLGAHSAAASNLAVNSAPAAASNKRPMRFADLQQMKRVGDPQISTGGKWVQN